MPVLLLPLPACLSSGWRRVPKAAGQVGADARASLDTLNQHEASGFTARVLTQRRATRWGSARPGMADAPDGVWRIPVTGKQCSPARMMVEHGR